MRAFLALVEAAKAQAAGSSPERARGRFLVSSEEFSSLFRVFLQSKGNLNLHVGAAESETVEEHTRANGQGRGATLREGHVQR